MTTCLKAFLSGLLILLYPAIGFGQLQTVHWHFGDSTSLHFTGDTVEAGASGGMFASEGCASISDNQGNLLFYSNGVTVWDARHQVMSRGDSLEGSLSARQGALIVPRPGCDSLYYLFIADSLGEGYGLSYNLIDMRRNNGLGSVVEKNKQLYTPTTERLAATAHQNGRDYWLLSHQWNSGAFYAYPITRQGIGSPVISHSGINHSFTDQILPAGTMKFSPNGAFAAININTTYGKKRLALFSFDKASGELTRQCTDRIDANLLSGLEFSTHSRMLYISGTDSLYQYNLTLLPDTAAFKASADVIHSLQQPGDYDFGALQLAPDGRIYHVKHPQHPVDPLMDDYPWLNAIHRPDSAGAACQYEKEAIDLAPGGAVFGLPGFVSHWFTLPAFQFNTTCVGDTTFFRFMRPFLADSVSWQFHDKDGQRLYAARDSAAFLFSRADSFAVEAYIYRSTRTDTQRQQVIVRPRPEINLGADTLLCGADSLTLDASPQNREQTGYGIYGTHSYVWQGLPDATPSLTISEEGAYQVLVRNFYGCQSRDSIEVQHEELPVFELGRDTIACYPDTVLLNPGIGKGTYTWQDQSHQKNYRASSPGTYWLQYRDTTGCSYSDTLQISFYHQPRVHFPPDTTLCLGETLTLEVQHPGHARISWQDGSKSAQYTIRDSGTYWVNARNKCGLAADTLEVDYRYCGPVAVPNVITPNNDGKNETFYIKGIDRMQVRLTIFNRWGKPVFHAEDYRNNWGAEHAAEGVYFYILEFTSGRKSIKGFLQVLR